MRPLFRTFKAHRVRYLIIGGQASILYGAAHFSQDLDLWIEPTDDNVRRFADALASLRARVHKLTPPMTRTYLKRGHGFHFLIPLRGGRVYLDAMGRPPRVGSFSAARKRSEIMPTPWGRLPVVSIRDLVELKKTNRPADYDVITRLAMIRVAREDSPGTGLLRWALSHLFRVEDVLELLLRFGKRMESGNPPGMSWVRRWRGLLGRGERPDVPEIDAAARKLGAKAQRLQAQGRRYWIVRIDELRRLRSEGRLLREGHRVTRAIASIDAG
jgi:hypothetical protein